MGLLSTIGAASGRAFGFTRSAIAAATDAFFNRVTLLLSGNGTNGAQNNTFLDSGSANGGVGFTVTRNGNTTQGTFSPFSQTGWSNYFDGTGDTLALPNNAAFAMSNGAFTIEFWFYTDSITQTGYILQTDINSTALYVSFSSSTLRLTDAGTVYVSTPTLVANTWNHIAVVRSGTGSNQTVIYTNGVAGTAGTCAQSFTQSGPVIGGNGYLGYISNLRIVKGSAVYTSGFTPPTAPLTNITNTSLLTCQSNRFVDNSTANSGSGFAITVNGNTSVQAFSPFAPTAAYSAATVGGSGYFDGNDYLTVAGGSSLAFGSGDFSLEAFVYPTASGSAMKIYDGRPNTTAGNYPVFERNASNVAVFYVDTTALITGTTVIQANTWTHVLVSRVSGNLRLFVNGVQDGSTVSNSTNFANGTARPAIAVRGSSLANDFLTGYISSIRVLIGSGFTSVTVPTAPLTAITNTSLLLNYTNAGITDATAKNVLETVGNAQISTTQSKFGGSSISFDGTGDWLLLPHTVDQFLSTGAFTIEFWLYLNATGAARGLVAKGTGTTGWLVSLDSSNRVVFTYTTSTITSTGTISGTTWTHIAVVREGTGTNQTKIYINGTNDGTGTVSTDFNQTNSMYVGADRTGGSALNGYIDDLRITKGYARYTANFTAPVTAFQLQ